MPTRTEVIQSKIQQYDAQITGGQSAVIDSSIVKLAIAQMAIGGGGGGGGSISSITISDGIDQSIDINTIIAKLTSIANNTSSAISTYTHTNPSITDTGGIVIAANSNRKGSTIVNRSTTSSIDLFMGVLGVFGTGLPLAPQQAYEINNTNLYLGVIRAIAPSGVTVNLAIIEGI